jgi:hypothetical protein
VLVLVAQDPVSYPVLEQMKGRLVTYTRTKRLHMSAVCHRNTRCDYEVPGMILLQAYRGGLQLTDGIHIQNSPLEHPCTYPNDAFRCWKYVWSFLFWNSICFLMSSVSRNLRLFKADFIFGNITKSCFSSPVIFFFDKKLFYQLSTNFNSPRRRNTHVLSAPRLPHNWR